jgi:hypothetical protein
MPYGHDPYKFTKQYARTGAQLASIVSNVPGQIQSAQDFEMKKEDRDRKIKIEDEAIAAVEKDWTILERDHKTLKSTYSKYADVLVNNGLMTPEEKDVNLKQLRAPMQADKKDARGYMNTLGKNFATLYTDAKTKVEQNNLVQQVQNIIGGAPEQKKTEFIGQQEPKVMTMPQEIKTGEGSFTERDITEQSKGGGSAVAPESGAMAGQAGFTETTTIPAQAPGTETREETLRGVGERQAEGQISPSVKAGQVLELPGVAGQASQKNIDYLNALQQKNTRAWSKVKQGEDDDFFKENQALWTDSINYENLINKTDALLGSTREEISSNDDAIVRITQELESEDPATLDEEETKAYAEKQNKVEELKKSNWNFNKELLRLEEKKLDQQQKHGTANRAWEKHTDWGKGGLYGKAVKEGKGEAKEESKTTVIPTIPKQRGKLPEKTVKDTAIGDVTLPGSTGKQFVQSFNSIEEAKKVIKPGKIARVRITTEEQARRSGKKIGEYMTIKMR